MIHARQVHSQSLSADSYRHMKTLFNYETVQVFNCTDGLEEHKSYSREQFDRWLSSINVTHILESLKPRQNILKKS